MGLKVYFDKVGIGEDLHVQTNSLYIDLDEDSVKIVMIWLIIGMGALIVVSVIFGGTRAGSAIYGFIELPEVIFGTVGSVGEELFFLSVQAVFWEILWVFPSLQKRKVIKEVITIGFISSLFVLFHTVVYANQMDALIYVLLLRIIMSVQFQFTRRPSISIITHLLNNVLVMSGIFTVMGAIFGG